MKITCINVYSMSEVLRMEIADWVKTFEGVIFSPRQESDSISPSAQGPLCPPNVNVECWGAFCCNRAVPFISMIVLPCLFNVCRTEHPVTCACIQAGHARLVAPGCGQYSAKTFGSE